MLFGTVKKKSVPQLQSYCVIIIIIIYKTTNTMNVHLYSMFPNLHLSDNVRACICQELLGFMSLTLVIISYIIQFILYHSLLQQQRFHEMWHSYLCAQELIFKWPIYRNSKNCKPQICKQTLSVSLHHSKTSRIKPEYISF